MELRAVLVDDEQLARDELGYLLGQIGGVEIIGHVGTAGGYRTVMFHLPAQDIDLTITMNQPDDLSPLLFPALKVLLAASR